MVDGKLLVYYDCLDGGLFVIVVEMVFVGKIGVIVVFDDLGVDDLVVLYSEELGVVI